MARQFQDSHDAQDAKDLHGFAYGLEVLQVARVQRFENDRDVEGHDGDQIDRIEHAFEELTPVGRGEDARNVLEGEPRDADGLDDEEKERLATIRVALVVFSREISGCSLSGDVNSVGVRRRRTIG